jgi:hypothetical protein
LIDTCGDTIYPAGYLAPGVKGFGITQVIDQADKTLSCFIRVIGGRMLVFIPFVSILLYKHRLPHLKKLRVIILPCKFPIFSVIKKFKFRPVCTLQIVICS